MRAKNPLAFIWTLVTLVGVLPVCAAEVHSTCVDTSHLDPSRCVVTQPKILNIYWDTGLAAWDAAAGPEFTQARIDAHSLALTRSTYFSQLAQYHIQAPEFLGGVTSIGCPPPPHGTANMEEMGDIVSCVRSAHQQLFAGINLVALFIPRETSPAWVTGGIFGITLFEAGDCSNYSAYHLLEPGMPDLPIAFIPLACPFNFDFCQPVLRLYA
jgi:hypothetical protein